MQLRPNNKLILLLPLFLIFTLSPVVNANEQEVTHLLGFIEKSGCTFIRNNKNYNSAKARKHIERKYKHIQDRITTTEEFIRYAATKSSITHKAYTVICGSEEVQPSSNWLLRELDLFREMSRIKAND